jgi:hypothetical protein
MRLSKRHRRQPLPRRKSQSRQSNFWLRSMPRSGGAFYARVLSSGRHRRLPWAAEKDGADILLCDLIDRISLDCPRKSLRWKRSPDQSGPEVRSCKSTGPPCHYGPPKTFGIYASQVIAHSFLRLGLDVPPEIIISQARKNVDCAPYRSIIVEEPWHQANSCQPALLAELDH